MSFFSFFFFHFATFLPVCFVILICSFLFSPFFGDIAIIFLFFTRLSLYLDQTSSFTPQGFNTCFVGVVLHLGGGRL